MPDEESRGPSCITRSKDSFNTARCSVDSRLINAKFVSYNDQVPPPSRLPSRLPDVMHVTLSPRLPPGMQKQRGKAWEKESRG